MLWIRYLFVVEDALLMEGTAGRKHAPQVATSYNRVSVPIGYRRPTNDP